ncbi:hypothetical protein JST97_33645 [bacterium]|nr:hypothetical protein [bacterium]
MFDRPEWWQVLLLITPISAIIYGLRWRETMLSNTSYKALTETQKGFALLHYMPPGRAAIFWNRMEAWERESYMKAGSEIRGSGKLLIAPLVKDVLKKLGKEGIKPPSTESNDPLEKLALAAEYCETALWTLLRDSYPASRTLPQG